MGRLIRATVVIVVLAGTAAAGYFVGHSRGEAARETSCQEVRAHRDAVFDEDKVKFREGRAQQHVLLGMVEELAILARQNPRCFTAGERAKLEAQFQDLKRAVFR